MGEKVNELTISIIINIAGICFIAGLYVQQLRSNTKAIDDLKEYFNEKFNDFKVAVAEHFIRVERKQDVHNKVIERTYSLECREDVQDEQIKVINHRIEDLENIK